MLADLALVGCYNGTLRHRTADTDRVLLASAKRNLAAMAYFGLTEFQKVLGFFINEICCFLRYVQTIMFYKWYEMYFLSAVGNN